MATPVVAVLNTSPDTVDLLRLALETAGLVVVTAFTHQVRSGAVDLEAFLRQHRPSAVLYDIAPPYDANWRLFEHLRAGPLRETPVVITSTNPKYVQSLSGENDDVYEIIGKPYDIERIVGAVKERVESST